MSDIESLFVRQEYESSNNNSINIDLKCPFKESTYVIISNTTDTQQRNINKLTNEVENSKNVETLLDHVNWRMFIYSCDQKSCYNSTYSSYKLQNPNCPNTTCCFSDSTDDLLSFSLRCGNTNCNKTIKFFIGQLWLIPLVLGLFCLLGNVVVMCDKAISLRKAQNKRKEIQIYNMLVFNLSMADLLMGVYLTAIAFAMKHEAGIAGLSRKPGACNILAIVNNVSSQVSLTLIFLISYYRYVGVIYPYKKHHFKVVVTTIFSTWIIWLVVAALPVFPFESLETAFTFGIVKKGQLDKDIVIDFGYFMSAFRTKISPSFSNVTEVTSIVHAVTQFPTPSVLEKLSIALGWINLKRDMWALVSYYESRYTCSINYFVQNENFRYYDFYTLMLLFYNLVFSIATLIFYIIVTFKIYESDNCSLFIYCKQYLNCFSGKKIRNNAIVGPAKAIRSAENREIFRRISIIMITDLMCWIPLCITSLIIWKFSDIIIQNREDYLATIIPFQTATLILVPLNSIVNPYIYSYKLWMHFFKNIKGGI